MERCERARGAGAPAFTDSLPANLAPSNTGFPCRGVLCHAGWGTAAAACLGAFASSAEMLFSGSWQCCKVHMRRIVLLRLPLLGFLVQIGLDFYFISY